MTNRILLVGGYGNFGTFIAKRLAREPEISLIIAGRSSCKARALAESLNVEWSQIDISADFERRIKELHPNIVIHTSGPFQGQGYEVAQMCVRNGIHYIDLADGRDFVANIAQLDQAAKTSDVLVVSGASTVPGLTSAILGNYAAEFETLDAIDFGITTAQKTNRGLATAKAILGYAGKPFSTMVDGQMRDIYGWQDLRWRKFRDLGWRALANCDVPDLGLFPKYFSTLKTIRFRAGLELPPLHYGLWALTWLARIGLVADLRPAAPLLLRLANLFDVFGSNDSGFYMEMTGRTDDARSKKIVFDLTARAGDGLMIPCIPAIVLAIGLANKTIHYRGAMPCVGVVSLDDILAELGRLRITWHVSRYG